MTDEKKSELLLVSCERPIAFHPKKELTLMAQQEFVEAKMRDLVSKTAVKMGCTVTFRANDKFVVDIDSSALQGANKQTALEAIEVERKKMNTMLQALNLTAERIRLLHQCALVGATELLSILFPKDT